MQSLQKQKQNQQSGESPCLHHSGAQLHEPLSDIIARFKPVITLSAAA